MKLLFCLKCHDLFRLIEEPRTCLCGETRGQYIDDLNAIYSGPAITLGINNTEFAKCIRRRQDHPNDELPRHLLNFPAFVIQNNCETFKRIKKDE